MSRRLNLLLTAGLLGLAGPAQANLPPIETLQYTVEKGDTCAAIVGKQYGDSSRYDILHEYNPQLGPQTPHHLEPGQTLTLPKAIPPQAWVTATWNTVKHRLSAAAKWKPAGSGTPLRVGYRVTTESRSAAELTFKDYSQIELGEQTLLIVYGRSADDAKKAPRNKATLERGTLRSRLAELRGKPLEKPVAPVEISTSAAVASLDGADAQMSIEDDGLSCVSNLEGGAIEVASATNARRKVTVKSGMGTRVKRGKKPEKPRRLPASPKWDGTGAVAAFGGTAEQAAADFAWKRVPKAARYLVRLESPEGAALASSWVPAGETSLRLQGLAAGTYQIRLQTKDSLGLVSRLSAPRAFTVAAVSGAATPVKVKAGSTIQGCAGAADPSAPEVKMDTAGTQTVTCGTQAVVVEVTP